MAKAAALPDPAQIGALINLNGLLQVHVTPNAKKSELGLPAPGDDRVLHVRTTATPEDGKANIAVCRMVAEALGIPKTAVTVARGATSRTKVLKVKRAGG